MAHSQTNSDEVSNSDVHPGTPLPSGGNNTVKIDVSWDPNLTVRGNFPQTIVFKQDSFDWSKLTMAILGTINLAAVIVMFAMTRNEKARERTQDNENEIDAFWIQKLILEPHVETIRNFFEQAVTDVRTYVHACREHESDIILMGRALSDRFAADFDELGRRVLEPLTVISPIFSEQLGSALDDLQEKITSIYDTHSFPDNSAINQVNGAETKFWATLFGCHKELSRRERKSE